VWGIGGEADEGCTGRLPSSWTCTVTRVQLGVVRPGASRLQVAGRPLSDDRLAPAEGETTNEEDRDDNWSAHVEVARELLIGSLSLGRKPSDLAEVLALLALAPCGHRLRAICRVTGGLGVADPQGPNAAGSRGGVSLAVQPARADEFIRRANRWSPTGARARVLCQRLHPAVLDEYAHCSRCCRAKGASPWRRLTSSPGDDGHADVAFRFLARRCPRGISR